MERSQVCVCACAWEIAIPVLYLSLFNLIREGKLEEGKKGRREEERSFKVIPKAEVLGKEMNYSVPDRKIENDPRYFLHLLPTSSNVGQDDNLIELLWKNGQVVLHNQTYCISPATIAECKQPQKSEFASKCGGSIGNSMNLIQGDETASWLPSPLDDSVESDFSNFFFGTRTQDPNATAKENLGKAEEEMGPSITSFGGVVPGSETVERMAVSSSMMIESSICGSSNHCQNNATNAKVMKKSLLEAAPREITFDPIIFSSSGGSGNSLGKVGKQITVNHDHKRKGRETGKSEHHIKDTEHVSLEANKHVQKTTTLRRTRAAEVHNLSERRRRDKINEKMKALQDLIPHCNRPDKASMLDEAIEYLKSLQLQVQIMWMGGGMAPMVFPGMQHYLPPRAGNGMCHPPLHSIPNPVQLPAAPLYNQFMPPISPPNPPVYPSPGVGALNFPNPMPNVRLPGPFPHYFGFPRVHLPPQVMDMYAYGSQVMQHNQTAAAVASNDMSSLGTSSENIQSD